MNRTINGENTVPITNLGSDLLPSGSNIYSIGSASSKWKNLNIGGDINVSSLPANSIPYINASKNISSMTLSNGQMLIGSNGSVPSPSFLNGTNNQINVTNGPGSVTLSLPQSINSSANTTFNTLSLTQIGNQIYLQPSGAGSSLIISTPSNPSGGDKIVTIPDPGTNAQFVLNTVDQSIGGNKTFISGITTNATSNQLTLGVTKTTTINANAPANSRVCNIPDVGANSNFILSEGTQTINGNKTYTATSYLTKSILGPNMGNLNAYGYLNSPANVVCNNTNGGSTADTSYPVLNLIKAGVGGVSHDTNATFYLYRYSNAGANGNTELQLGLLQGAVVNNTDTNFIAWKYRADGTNAILGSADATSSTSPSSLTTAGGVAIAKSLYVGTTIFASASTNQLVLGGAGGSTGYVITAPPPAVSKTYTIPDVGSSCNFVLTDGAQTLNNKSLANSGDLNISSSARVNVSAGTTIALTSTSNLYKNITGIVLSGGANLGTTSTTGTTPYINSNLNVISNSNNGGNTADTPYPLMSWIKSGVGNQSYDCFATWYMYRYSNSNNGCNTELQLGLANGGVNNGADPNTIVWKFRADGSNAILGTIDASSSTSSSSLSTAGGMAVAKSLYVGSGVNTNVVYITGNKFATTTGTVVTINAGAGTATYTNQSYTSMTPGFVVLLRVTNSLVTATSTVVASIGSINGMSSNSMLFVVGQDVQPGYFVVSLGNCTMVPPGNNVTVSINFIIH